MPVTARPSRRFVLLLLLASAFLSIIFLGSIHNRPTGLKTSDVPVVPAQHVEIKAATLTGHTIMPKLGNETAKAELGRAAWKLFHTTFARFPDKPTEEESSALQAYIHLFQRLYPCGECASHFRTILDKYPPQVSSRSTAAAWGCHVHNEVNKSLNKDIFDCSNIGDFYDCGCAEDEAAAAAEATAGARKDTREKPEMSTEDKERITGSNGRDFDMGMLKLEEEGYTRGG